VFIGQTDHHDGGWDPNHFEFDIKMFQTATAKLVFSAHGSTNHVYPGELLGRSQYWPNERFFVFPLSAERDRVLLLDTALAK
jgi:hypothetical protein